MELLTENAVATAIDAGAKIAAERLKVRRADGLLDAKPFVILHHANGQEEVRHLDERFGKPPRKQGTVKLHDADSFIAYYAMHGNGAPIYASIDPGQFVAVLNDHTTAEAGFRDHRAMFRLQHSPEWTTWTKHAGAGAAFNGNEAFALFIQDNLPDIIAPNPADMLAMALNFRIGETVAFRNAVNLADGNTEFQYDSIVDGSSANAKGSKIKIPGAFLLSLPVLAGIKARKYQLNARFRYRLRDGKLALWYELERPHKVVEQSFADLWSQIERTTKAPVLHGTPE